MNKKLSSIQAARTIAILMVLLVHVGAIARAVGAQQQVIFLDFGSAGVDLFFVVSGFIMSVVAAERERNPTVFFTKRFLRIFPMYWIFTLVWLVMSVIVDRGATDGEFVLRSLFIWPQFELPYLFVGWSLEHEIIFYGIVGVLLTLRAEQYLAVILATLFAVGIANHVALPDFFDRPPFWDYHLLSLYHFDFLLGVLIFRFRHRLILKQWRTVIFLSLLAFPAIAYFLLPFFEGAVLPTQPEGALGLVRVLTFGVASAGLIIGLWSAEQYSPSHIFAWSLANRIGDASFSLYLSHHIVFAVIAYTVLKIGIPAVFIWPLLLIAIGVAILFSLAWYDKIEAPYNRMTGRAFRTTTPRPAT
ncbi:acyltransferase family protein [Agrobacterium cavarae]|uniref:acyltransferase family protein n=1 Tax=Agrobacterium cavarae TaxID=2528239 RepID=UPI003FD46696